MTDIRFKRYLENNYYNELFYPLKKHIDKNRNNVTNTCLLHEISIKSISLGDDNGSWFYGDLYIDAIVKNFEDDLEDGHRENYFIKIRGDLSDLKKTFRVLEIDDEPHLLKRNLNNNFVPYYEQKEYDEVASEFLHTYYPELQQNQLIDIDTLLKRLGLKLEYTKLSLNNDVFGMIIFEDTELTLYDSNNKGIKKRLEKNTILIDNNVRLWFNETRDRCLFTIIHECVHYHKHKKYYFFLKLIADQKAVSICNTSQDYNKIESIKYMEIQANKIASRVIMPKDLLLDAIKKYSSRNRLECARDYELMLEELKEKYNVSYSALKVRLNELGYNKLVGIKEYIDNHYVLPYISNDEIKPNESYSISALDFLRLSIVDRELTQELNKKEYIYVDCHICINDEKYISRDGNIITMTEYALNNINECCLKFNYEYKTCYGIASNDNIALCRLGNYIKPNITFVNTYTRQEEENYNPTIWKEDLDRLTNFKSNLPGSFNQTLRKLIEEFGTTQQALADDAHLSISTIERLLSKPNPKVKRITIMKICIALHLPQSLSKDLFEKAGLPLVGNDQEVLLMDHIISYFFHYSLSEVLKIFGEVLDKYEEDE